MKSKKVISIALALGMLVSSVNVAFTSTIKDGKLQINLPFIKNFSSEKQEGKVLSNNIVKPDAKALKTARNKEITIQLPDKSEVIYKGVKKSYTKDLKSSDIFSYSQEEMEQLLEQGYSIEDIVKADEVGNRLIEEPKKLLEMKADSKKDWTGIEKEVQNSRNHEYVSKMKEKYPDEYKKLAKEKFSDEDMSKIFTYIHHNNVASVDSLISSYKTQGESALKYSESSADKIKVSKSYMDKLGLSESDIKGLSDESLKTIEEIAKKKGITAKELVKQVNSLLPSIKGGKTK
jgi:hypothetical protein